MHVSAPPQLRPDTRPLEVVVLVSGSGSLLQALIDAEADAAARGQRSPFTIVAVGADRECAGLERAMLAGIPTFVVDTAHFADRDAWDEALADAIERSFDDDSDDPDVPPHLVVSAGFMKILGATTLARHTVINTHPALLPSFPGAHGVRDALAHGVKITGTTCHVVDAGVDTGPIIAQRAVEVRADDDEDSLHERIKVEERDMLVDVVRRFARGWSINGRTVLINE